MIWLLICGVLVVFLLKCIQANPYLVAQMKYVVKKYIQDKRSCCCISIESDWDDQIKGKYKAAIAGDVEQYSVK